MVEYLKNSTATQSKSIADGQTAQNKLTQLVNHSLPVLEVSPGILMIKDLMSTYAYCNTGFVDLLKFNRNEEIIGVDDSKLPWADFTGIYQGYDKKIFETGNKIDTIIPMLIKDGSLLTANTLKKPIIDDGNNIIGLIAYTTIVNTRSASKTFSALRHCDQKITATSGMMPHSYQTTEAWPVRLTKRESECLFYTLRAKTAKETARFLEISHRTVEEYINTLKEKFQCHTKQELIGKAIDLGFMEMLPESIDLSKLKASLMH